MSVFRSAFAYLVALVCCVGSIQGQDFNSTGASYVPETAIMASRMNAQQFLKSPGFDWLPIEVAEAWSKQMLGLDPLTIVEIKSVTGMPAGPGESPIGVIVTLAEDYDPANISADLLAGQNPRNINGRQAFALKGSRPEMLVHAIGPRKVLIAAEQMFEPMLAAADGAGPVAELIRANPMGDQNSQMVLAVEPLRPMIMPIIEQAASGLPAELNDLTKIPELLSAVIVESGANGPMNTFDIELLCKDADAATELKDILEQSIEFGRMMAIGEISNNIRGQGRVPDAQRAYVARLANHLVGLIKPVQDNDRVVINIESQLSVASAGVMVGLLLPAVQSAREAARRMTASNNLKQIALAFHNYHSAYNKLPPPAIVDEDGKPLLSWRVAILPFIEQQALYEQFHLDEPWDSDHNIQLANQVIDVYTDPSLPLPPGQTVFRVVVGEDIGLNLEGDTRFRDILDGTSNTLMVIEADKSQATVWSKPDLMEIDLENPMPQMGHAHPGGFHATMMDGSVRFIVHTIDTNLFRALLTRAGGEAVGGFWRSSVRDRRFLPAINGSARKVLSLALQLIEF